MNYLKRIKAELKPSKETLLFVLHALVFLMLTIGAAAQKPFHQQVNERIEYLNGKRIEVSSRSLSIASGLHLEVVKDVRLGEVTIVSEIVLDAFCDELICGFEIIMKNGKRYINLLPKEEKKRSEVYSKGTGEIVFTTWQ